jgi:Predicted SAM-dependent methyltransferases
MAEGLPSYVKLAKGSFEEPVELEENGLRFLADPQSGQKTGWFFDQRDNRAAVARLAAGLTVLDVYSYAGGFTLAAAKAGAREVTAIDRSEAALALAEKSAATNGLATRCRFRRAEAFEELERLDATGTRFGMVVADPPAFVKSKKDLKQGARAYRKLARLAAPWSRRKASSSSPPAPTTCRSRSSSDRSPAGWSMPAARGAFCVPLVLQPTTRCIRPCRRAPI